VKVVFGIGNPGRRYLRTRHNAGFRVVEALADAVGASWERGEAGLTGEGTLGAERVLLVKPQDYVNCSGASFGRVQRWHRLDLADMLVVCDDFHLPVGAIRARRKGSSAGHNGLQSILDTAGTPEVPRLRVGIGPLRSGWDAADFVLSVFDADEEESIADAIARAADAAGEWVRHGIEACMNRCNRTGPAPE